METDRVHWSLRPREESSDWTPTLERWPLQQTRALPLTHVSLLTSLLLSTTQSVTGDGLVVEWKSHDEVVGIGYLGCLLYFFISGVRFAEADVLFDGAVEENGLLTDDGDV